MGVAMSKDHKVELADIIRENINKIKVTFYILKVLTNIMNCRTSRLGGYIKFCTDEDCHNAEIYYNSCKDRNCPKCQGIKRSQWVSDRLEEVLPVKYFHVVFTIPFCLRKVFQFNNKLCYQLLFKAVSTTLIEVGIKNRKLKGVRLGFMALLHTWTQKLDLHPHIHCIVPGGGLSKDKKKWKSCHSKYLLPNKILSIVFRAKLLSYLEKAYDKGQIYYPDTESDLKYINNFKATLKQASRVKWNIYTKKTFAGPAQVINYLGSYTHRVAISNSRIISLKNGVVKFKWKDRSDGNKTKEMELDAVTFLKRFILHIIPKRFCKIRYYGYMANNCRKKNIPLCRKLIKEAGLDTEEIDYELQKCIAARIQRLKASHICPVCKKGTMELILNFDPFCSCIELPFRGG